MNATLEQKPLVWSELWDAMRSEPDRWQYTAEAMYHEMLGVLPPAAMGGGAFLVGEANHHNEQGHAVYACFYHVNGDYLARYMTRAEFREFLSIRN